MRLAATAATVLLLAAAAAAAAAAPAAPAAPAPAPPAPPAPAQTPPSPCAGCFLGGRVIGGLTNQKMSLWTGLAVAHLFNLTLVLPPAHRSPVARTDDDLVPLGTFFDVPRLLAQDEVRTITYDDFRALSRARPITQVELPNLYGRYQTTGQMYRYLGQLINGTAAPGPVLFSTGSMFDAWLPSTPDEFAWWWHLESLVQPAPRLVDLAERARAQLRNLTDSGMYTAVHFRAEAYSHQSAHSPGHSAAGYISELIATLVAHNVSKESPLFFATGVLERSHFHEFAAQGYRVALFEQLADFSLYERASIHFLLALAAEGPFVGFPYSVSTFSGLICDLRRQRGLPVIAFQSHSVKGHPRWTRKTGCGLEMRYHEMLESGQTNLIHAFSVQGPPMPTD